MFIVNVVDLLLVLLISPPLCDSLVTSNIVVLPHSEIDALNVEWKVVFRGSSVAAITVVVVSKTMCPCDRM